MGDATPSGAVGLSELSFFRAIEPLTLASLAATCAVPLPDGVDPGRPIRAAASLARAAADEVSALLDGHPVDDLRSTRAGACFVAPRDFHHVPAGTVALVTGDPDAAFRRVAGLLHAGSVRPASLLAHRGLHTGARVHADALLEDGVAIDDGAIVGPGVEIGSGTFIGAHAVIAAGVRIGRGCAIDAGVCLSHALLGDRVIIQAGARIGLGGAVPASPGLLDPRLGRVIIQNDVAIGANGVVERGRLGDTVVGEGSSVEPLAYVAADTLIDRGTVFRRR